ncbi:MAG: flagellar hook protein FlgE [Gammaproteobacteria bacterium]|nr:flagellar hook protein FlgE [Gammaproteobacteria bacterium]
MSFQIGLSGMRAASKDLNVTGNNIANAGTVGFKRSRAEFADVYAATVLGTGKTQNGSGVLLADVAQLFQQGVINSTENPLDMAINGNGFFQVQDGNGFISYTRAGFFGTDTQGNIIDNYGNSLLGFGVNEEGRLVEGDVMTRLRLDTQIQEPRATKEINQIFNLNSTLPVVDTAMHPFDPAKPETYSSATSTSIYDAQGNQHTMSQFFVKTGANQWQMHVLIDGAHPRASLANAAVEQALKESSPPKTPDEIFQDALDAVETPPDNDNLYTALNSLQGYITTQEAAYQAATLDSEKLKIQRDVASEIAKMANRTPVSLNIEFDAKGELIPITDTSNPNLWVDGNTTLMTDDQFWVLHSDGSVTMNKWLPGMMSTSDPSTLVYNGSEKATEALRMDFTKASQYASTFAVSKVTQDGYTTGNLTGVEIDDTGKIFARYSNNQSKLQGQVVLADFANVQGLQPVGKTQWVQTQASGGPIRNPGTVGTMGAINSGALEESNVELSDQLIQLIVAQRNYQANAKTIETQSAITQTIINMR